MIHPDLTSGDSACPQCGGPLALRQKHPYPIAWQVGFAISFVGFLFFFERLKLHREWLWAWTALQTLLGIGLIRGRLRSRARVYRCIRCSADLP